jgi:hypothetical protein
MPTKPTDTIPKFTSSRDVLSVDPGDTVSAWVISRPWKMCEGKRTPFRVMSFGRMKNQNLRNHLGRVSAEDRKDVLMVIEMLRTRGMPTANQEFETCVQIGMFRKLWLPGKWSYAFRGDIKLCLCGVTRAKDSNVRTALIELWGGEQKAMAGKKCPKCKGKGWFGAGRPVCPVCRGIGWATKPGPLAGMAADEWAALAVAYWWHMEGKIQHHIPPPKSTKKKKNHGKARTSVVAGRKSKGVNSVK